MRTPKKVGGVALIESTGQLLDMSGPIIYTGLLGCRDKMGSPSLELGGCTAESRGEGSSRFRSECMEGNGAESVLMTSSQSCRYSSRDSGSQVQEILVPMDG